MQYFIIIGLLFISSFASSQAIQNIKASFLSGKITIAYDLEGGDESQKYEVEIFSSHNQFGSPLKNVTGDVGRNITLGKNKTIIWDATEELISFKGDINFRLRAVPIILPFAFTSPSNGAKLRRGKARELTWEGGKKDQIVTLELFQKGERVQLIADTPNTGNYVWRLPRDLKKGIYSIKISSGKNDAEVPNVSIQSKVPLFIKLIPVAVAAGVVTLISGGGGGSSDLPAAPTRPN